MDYKTKLPSTKKSFNPSPTTKRNKYEKAIYRPIKVLTFSGVTLIALNLLLPVVNGSMGFKSPFQLAMMYVYICGIVNCRGLNVTYNIPIGSCIGIRLVEGLVRLLPKISDLNTLIFFILILLDITFLVGLGYHKSKYEFEVEKYVK